jgi:hypothetical protein
MNRLIRLWLLLACIAASGASPNQNRLSQDRIAWVSDTLNRMLSIGPGMTRGDLLKVFTTAGGLATVLDRPYVSRDCPYFKVDVRFEPVGGVKRDAEGRVTNVEDNRDIIRAISRPYLSRIVTD